MKSVFALAILASTVVPALAGQAPGPAETPDVPISNRDRFYTADQFSNTVTVVEPSTNKALGIIKLGEKTPANLSPLYRGQLLVHGIGFSPDHKTLAVVSIGSNSVSFIDTETNVVKHVSYVGRSPHEAFFRPDGREVWVSVRGESYIAVLDGKSFAEIARITVPNGPGMTIFSPDGRYGYVCSSFSPETVVIDTATKKKVGRIKQDSPFCPDIAATPDDSQVWLTLKDIGRTMVFEARPPFAVLKIIDTGPITNHVNIVRNAKGQFAYVTIGGLNQIKVFDTDGFKQVATIPVGSLPHGLWPSGDGRRVYVGLENADALAVIDTATNSVVATIPVGQAPQGVAYITNAVEKGDGLANLQSLAAAYKPEQLSLTGKDVKSVTQVSLFDQGLVQVMQAAVTGLEPKKPYVLALSRDPKGQGSLEPVAEFMSNPAGAAIVNTVGPLRTVVEGSAAGARRYLVIAEGTGAKPGAVVQAQKLP